MSSAHTLSAAQARDARDPLAALRARFALPLDARGEPLIYLCGHSLGLLPLAARERVLEELDEWARLVVRHPRPASQHSPAHARMRSWR